MWRDLQSCVSKKDSREYNLNVVAQQNCLALLHTFSAKSIVTQIHLNEVKLLQTGADNVQGAQSLIFRTSSDDVAHVRNSYSFQTLKILSDFCGSSIVKALVAQSNVRRVVHSNRAD